MKILLVHNRYRSGTPGGEDAVFDQQRKQLLAAGHEVVVYERLNDELYATNLRARFRALHALVFNSVITQEIRQLIDETQPDVVHAHNLFPLIRSALYDATLKTRTPLVQTLHNYRWSCAAATHYVRGQVCVRCSPMRYRHALLRRCYRQSSLWSWWVAKAHARMWQKGVVQGAVSQFLALTPFAANRLMAAGIAPHRVTICPNWVEEAPAAPPDASPPYAVFSGRLAREKGVMTLLEAWRSLPDIELRIIGEGPMRHEMQAFIAQYDLPVKMLGYLPADVARGHVAAARLQIVPSEWFEGMPLVVLEAWAQRVPVLAARIGGLGGMIVDDEDGLLFEPQNSDALIGAVRRAWEDTEARDRWAKNGYRRALDQHAPLIGLARLEHVYQTAINSRQVR